MHGQQNIKICFHIVLFAGLLDKSQLLESTATTYFNTFVIILMLYVPYIV